MIEYNDWSDIFTYDETSPSFLRWKVPVISGKGSCKIKPGDVAGSPNGSLRWFAVPKKEWGTGLQNLR